MAEEQERGISLLQTWTSRVNLYPPPNLNSNMLKTDLKASSTTRTWLNPVSTRKLLGWSSLNTRYSGGPVWALNNYCFSNHCNVHDLLFTLINSTTVCHNFSSVHHSVKLWFSIMWSVEFFHLICFLLCFDQVFPQLYFHMLRQRRRVLHGEVIVEKDDWVKLCNHGAFSGKEKRVKTQNFLWFFWVQVLKHGTRINNCA